MGERKKDLEGEILKRLYDGEKSTGEVARSFGYVRKSKTKLKNGTIVEREYPKYNNVDGPLKKLEEKGYIDSELRKGIPGHPPTYWWVILSIDNIRRLAKIYEHHIPFMQRSRPIVEMITEAYKEHIHPRIDSYLRQSPTFSKTFLQNEPRTVANILKKHYTVSAERRRIEELFISKCIFKEEENSTCLLRDGTDLRCYRDMNLECVDEEAIADAFGEMIGVIPYFKSCLTVDSIENPEEEKFLKILDKVDEAIYLTFYTLMYDICTFRLLQEAYTKVKDSFKEEIRDKFDEKIKTIQEETIGENWRGFLGLVTSKREMAPEEINEKIEKLDAGIERMRGINQEIMTAS
ncbi:MAG: hypothetical protein MASP_01739 [Candidatus Methanolliviera sp. GoM_asphalt]|nr:MAG: hypothetical protein MASP_01739 [Candidatus Methanolliviera sp. GoM_asphalt]